MATLQEVFDQTTAALADQRLPEAVEGLAVLERYAQHIDAATLTRLRAQVFTSASKAGLTELAASVLAARYGEAHARHSTLADAAQALATTPDPEAAEVARGSIELLTLVSSADARRDAAEALAEGMAEAVAGPFEQALGEFVHDRVPAPWWPHLLDRAKAQFGAAERWIEGLVSYAVQTDINEMPEAVFRVHGSEHPRDYRAWLTLKHTFPLVINVLSQVPEALAAARDDDELRRLVRSLDRYHPNIHHLDHCLETLVDAPFLILHPRRRQGFELRVRGINHLESFQTLMHAALHGDPAQGYLAAPRPDEATIAVVAGTSPQMQAEAVTSNVWGLFSWPALREDGSLTGVDTNAALEAKLGGGELFSDGVEFGTNFVSPNDPNAAALFEQRSGDLPAVEPAHVSLDPGDPAPYRYKIDDAGRPATIPSLDGRRVVLLTGRTRLARWQALRQFPYMRGEFVIESVLSPEQVDAALARLGAARHERCFWETECEAWHLAGISERNIAGPARARPILEHAFAYAEQLRDGARLVEVGHTLGGCLRDEPGADIRLWQRAIAAIDGADPSVVSAKHRAQLLYMLGISHEHAQQLDEAEGALAYAVGWLAEVEGEHDLRATILSARGRLFARRGQRAQAEASLHAALAAAEASSRPIAPILTRVSIYRTLADVALRVDDDVDTAIDCLLLASRTAREGLGEWHPEVAFVMETLGQLSEATGDHERARKCFHKADVLLAETRHASEQAGMVAAATEANQAIDSGRLAIALRRLERHQAIAVELHGPDHEVAVRGRELMADVRARM